MQLNNLSTGPLAYASAGAAPLALQVEEDVASAPGMVQESYRSGARVSPDGDLDAPDFDALSSEAEAFINAGPEEKVGPTAISPPVVNPPTSFNPCMTDRGSLTTGLKFKGGGLSGKG